jgi:DNA-binding XRE family transcriptional regulator
VELKNRIKEIRSVFGVSTQAKLAEILGVNEPRVKSLETGRVKELDAREAYVLVKNFNLSFDWLLTGNGSMTLEERKSNLVVTHGDINSNGEGNIILNGVQDCDINHQIPSKPTNKSKTTINSEEELNELCELIKEYATPRYRMEIKEKLLRFKELH